MNITKSLVLSLVAAAATAVSAHGALPYTGATYTQDFNGLPLAGSGSTANRGPIGLFDNSTTTGVGTFAGTNIDGWYGANPGGSSTSTEYRAQNGSLSGAPGRGVVSFGTTDSTDRALGTLATSNQINTFGLVLTNSTNATIDRFLLSFTGEQWRRGALGVVNNLSFDYAISSNTSDNISSALTFTDVPELDFVNPNTLDGAGLNEIALDGNLPANQTALSKLVTGINWAPGQVLILRWNGQDASGQDNGLAIDNLSFSTPAVPEPASMALLAVGAGALLARRRR